MERRDPNELVRRAARQVYDAGTALDRAVLPPDTEAVVHAISSRTLAEVAEVLRQPEPNHVRLQFTVVRTMRDLEAWQSHPVVAAVSTVLRQVHEDLKPRRGRKPR